MCHCKYFNNTTNTRTLVPAFLHKSNVTTTKAASKFTKGIFRKKTKNNLSFYIKNLSLKKRKNKNHYTTS